MCKPLTDSKGFTTLAFVLIFCLIIAGIGVVFFYITNLQKQSEIVSQSLSATEDSISIFEKAAKPINPTITTTTSSPTQAKNLTYNINYYDIDAAPENERNFVKPGITDTQLKNFIENVYRKNNLAPSYVNQIAVVFMKIDVYDGKTLGIYQNGQQTLVQPLEKGRVGTIGYTKGRFIALESGLTGDELEATLIHELGHVIFQDISKAEFIEFMKLRKFSDAITQSWVANKYDGSSSMPTYADNWPKSPGEDFAENVKVYFGKKSTEYPWAIRTEYGNPTSEVTAWFDRVVKPIVTD